MHKGFMVLAFFLVIVALFSLINRQDAAGPAARSQRDDRGMQGQGGKGTAALVPAPGEKAAELTVLGMYCTSCSAAVAAILEKTEGVSAFRVNRKMDSVSVVYKPDVVTLEEITSKIASLGYQPQAVIYM